MTMVVAKKERQTMGAEFNSTYVLRGYVECALWTETTDNGEPLDGLYSQDDIAPDSQRDMLNDIEATLETVANERPETFDRMSAEQFGHDFWLTRNGHGAGFWDRGLGELGDWLTSLVKPYGESYLYVGDDGSLHVA